LIKYGKPITVEEVKKMNHNELREEFLKRLKDCVDYDSDEKKIN